MYLMNRSLDIGRLSLGVILGLSLVLSLYIFSISVLRNQEELAEFRARVYAKAWLKITSPQGSLKTTLTFLDLYIASGGEIDKDILQLVKPALKRDTYFKDLYFLGSGLGITDQVRSAELLSLASKSTDPDIRRVANSYRILLLAGPGVKLLKEGLKDYLSRNLSEEQVEFIMKLIEGGAKLLGGLIEKQVKKLTKDDNPIVRAAGLYILAGLLKHKDLNTYKEALSDPVGSVRLTALSCLLFLNKYESLNLSPLKDALKLLLMNDEEESVRLMSLALLSRISTRSQTFNEVLRGELVPEPATRSRLSSFTWRDRHENPLIMRWRAYSLALVSP